MQRQNIVLIGDPAAGKSTVSRMIVEESVAHNIPIEHQTIDTVYRQTYYRGGPGDGERYHYSPDGEFILADHFREQAIKDSINELIRRCEESYRFILELVPTDIDVADSAVRTRIEDLLKQSHIVRVTCDEETRILRNRMRSPQDQVPEHILRTMYHATNNHVLETMIAPHPSYEIQTSKEIEDVQQAIRNFVRTHLALT